VIGTLQVLGVLAVVLPTLGVLYWVWYRSALDDGERSQKPSGGAVFLASLGCGGTVFLVFALLFAFMFLVTRCTPEARF
jgi:hypothetical protein